MKKPKTKTEMLRRINGPVIKSVESVLRPEESLWWERFVKEVGFRQVLCQEWKREGVMDDESGELTEWEDVVWTGKSETEGLEWGQLKFITTLWSVDQIAQLITINHNKQ